MPSRLLAALVDSRTLPFSVVKNDGLTANASTGPTVVEKVAVIVAYVCEKGVRVPVGRSSNDQNPTCACTGAASTTSGATATANQRRAERNMNGLLPDASGVVVRVQEEGPVRRRASPAAVPV
jgi:hypothetical protein